MKAALGKLGEPVLITGAAGSIGSALAEALLWRALETDLDTMDVRDESAVRAVIGSSGPTLIFHLAGAKHAPLGEEDPWEAANINIIGTRNVLAAADMVGARVITASTCKACNPETAYGATKLIAERMTLNAGGSVARFYNVRESSGNVFEIWEALEHSEPIPVTPCRRLFMSMDDAVALLLWTAVLPPGRYAWVGAVRRDMRAVARELYPHRKLLDIPPRRGDRLDEPLMATQELAHPVDESGGCVRRIIASHDQVPVLV